MHRTIAHEELRRFLTNLFLKRGLEEAKANAVANSLVAADTMGRASHGAALAPWYLDAVRDLKMARSGAPTTLSDRGACIAWAGGRLPGAWLIQEAMALCLDRVATYGTVTASIADSFHAGALAVYLSKATEQGCMIILSCSGPDARWMPPFGGTAALFSTNPVAIGIPTADLPILADVSCSITTVNQARQLVKTGSRFPGPWGMDASGNVTDDPAEVLGGGALLPVGGPDHGHKGYAFALMVEALTQGLTGFGRVRSPDSPPNPVATNIYLQVIDPTAFGGADSFRQEMSWVVEACRRNRPRDPAAPVRVPGENALALREKSLIHGVSIAAPVAAALMDQARALSVEVPDAVARLST